MKITFLISKIRTRSKPEEEDRLRAATQRRDLGTRKFIIILEDTNRIDKKLFARCHWLHAVVVAYCGST